MSREQGRTKLRSTSWNQLSAEPHPMIVQLELRLLTRHQMQGQGLGHHCSFVEYFEERILFDKIVLVRRSTVSCILNAGLILIPRGYKAKDRIQIVPKSVIDQHWKLTRPLIVGQRIRHGYASTRLNPRRWTNSGNSSTQSRLSGVVHPL